MAGHFLCLGGDHLRKLKKYKPTKFKAKDSVYNKELADYAVSFIECLCHTKGCRTDFADIQNKKECGGNRQWQNHYLRNWAANTKGKLFIPIQGCLLEVVREQYTDFYRDKERWRYLQKLDTKNRLLSLDGFTDSEGNPLDFITDEAVDIAETVVNAVMVDRLKAALPLLSDSEQELIQAIFFDGLSEREVGARLGITQSVVNKRKARILRKLRKIIEN